MNKKEWYESSQCSSVIQTFFEAAVNSFGKCCSGTESRAAKRSMNDGIRIRKLKGTARQQMVMNDFLSQCRACSCSDLFHDVSEKSVYAKYYV